MFAGLQIQISALSAIIPDSFIFVLDSTDRSFIYKSTDCCYGIDEIISLDKTKGIDNLFHTSDYYNSETTEHSYMISRVSPNTFLGFFALKEKFSDTRIKDAQEYFLKMRGTATS